MGAYRPFGEVPVNRKAIILIKIVKIFEIQPNLAPIAIGVLVFRRRDLPSLRLGGRSGYLVGSPGRRLSHYRPRRIATGDTPPMIGNKGRIVPFYRILRTSTR